jgi:hypothetical protein
MWANEAKEELELVLSYSPSLRIAHELKEELGDFIADELLLCSMLLDKRCAEPTD